VDDDPSMRDVIRNYLESENFQVSAVSDGRGMARVLSDSDKAVDLIILDLKLADEDGLDLMRGLGGRSDVPIILVTGHRREETDRVVGLELGADSGAGARGPAPIRSRRTSIAQGCEAHSLPLCRVGAQHADAQADVASWKDHRAHGRRVQPADRLSPVAAAN